MAVSRVPAVLWAVERMEVALRQVLLPVLVVLLALAAPVVALQQEVQ